MRRFAIATLIFLTAASLGFAQIADNFKARGFQLSGLLSGSYTSNATGSVISTATASASAATTYFVADYFGLGVDGAVSYMTYKYATYDYNYTSKSVTASASYYLVPDTKENSGLVDGISVFAGPVFSQSEYYYPSTGTTSAGSNNQGLLLQVANTVYIFVSKHQAITLSLAGTLTKYPTGSSSDNWSLSVGVGFGHFLPFADRVDISTK